MAAKDRIKITGTFRCKVYKRGELILEYEDKNLVVQAGLDWIAKMVAGETVPSLTKVGFGTSNTAPSLSDTSLTTLFSKPANSVDFDNTGTVLIEWQHDPGESNGRTIQEFGLMLLDDSLFARKVGLVIAKDINTSATGTWTIQIT
jgi:hypothetical protein